MCVCVCVGRGGERGGLHLHGQMEPFNSSAVALAERRELRVSGKRGSGGGGGERVFMEDGPNCTRHLQTPWNWQLSMTPPPLELA